MKQARGIAFRVRSVARNKIRISMLMLINLLIRVGKFDLRHIFYDYYGFLKCNDLTSGEFWFLDHVLKEIMSDVKNPVFLDVGANIGAYTQNLISIFAYSTVYCFEPSPVTFKTLEKNIGSHKNVVLINAGVASCEQNIDLFTYRDDASSGHASIYSEVLTDLHKNNSIKAYPCHLDTIDNLLSTDIGPIPSVHFIKIDTEGCEYDGLKGASQILASGSVRAIQIEFNEMNVISRVFLKDFYDLLGPDYIFFRLDTRRLIKLGEYSPHNEIFVYQNLVAIRREYAELAEKLGGGPA